MGKSQFGLVVEYVKDIEAAKRFYVDILGMEVERTAPNYVQFGQFAIAADQPLGGTGEPEFYWFVQDAQGAYSDLSKKAEVTLPLTQQPFGKVFGVKNTEGRTCFLLELAQERPSRPAE
jgi:catechol 2,3-dioxygenase-like lactoylglutathione lyase family enzyme